MNHDPQKDTLILFTLSCLMWTSLLLPLLIASKGHIFQALWLYRSIPVVYIMLFTPLITAALSKITLSLPHHISILASLYCCNILALFRTFALCRKNIYLFQHFLQTVHIGIILYFLCFCVSFLLLMFSSFSMILSKMSLEEFMEEETAEAPFRIIIKK